MRFPRHIWLLAERIVDKAGAEGLMLATAESCTGGMVAAAITDVPGSSAVFDRGFVTYSNEAKAEMLGAPPAIIETFGAVSRQTACAMANGALERSRADIAVSITGIAGPGGGTDRKPVGLVWFALAAKGRSARAERRVFTDGDRGFVRMRAAQTALMLLLRAM
ncbi:MAG: CinA family protein [Parvularculaceae bacterium]|nr:CinA family protein [Parvularculaceae bacterium]